MAPSPGIRWAWTRLAAMSSRWKWRMYGATLGMVVAASSPTQKAWPMS